jgi:serine protease AprX
MRNTCLCLLLLTLGNAVALSAQGAFSKIEKTLHADIQAGRTRDVLLIFAEKTDLSPARYVRGKAAKAQFVVDALQKTARRSHANALALIRQHNGAANSLFMVNAIALRAATPALLEALAGLPELRSIAADPWVFVEHPVEETQGQAVAERSTIEWGVDRINAPALWAQGYSGQGISVGGADTGYDWEHPALSGHYRGTGTDGSIDHNYHWHDAIKAPSPLNSDSLNKCGFDVKHPCDDGLHGTHTMGTMIGDDGLGNQIGVAPGAKWIGCRNMERGWGQPSTYIECFQWFLAPTDLDGLNPDVARAPHVINNSWYCRHRRLQQFGGERTDARCHHRTASIGRGRGSQQRKLRPRLRLHQCAACLF